MRTIACLGLLGLLACGPSTSGGDPDGPPALASLTISPATAELVVVDGATARQAFTVTATYADGTSVDVTAAATLTADAAFGDIDGAAFVADGAVAGVTLVSAHHGDAIVDAEVTVRVRNHRVDGGAPAGAAGVFDGATVDPTRLPTLVYPPADATMPANLGDFDVHWDDPSAGDVVEVSLVSAYAEVYVYLAASPSWMVFTPAEWTLVARNAASVTAQVRVGSTASPGVVGETAPRPVTLTDQGIAGGLYYWAAGSSVPGAPYGIFRHDVALPGQPAEPFFTTTEAGRCVACHVLSRDGTKMAVTYDGGNGATALVDVGTRTASAPLPNWNFASYTAEGDKLIAASHGVLSVRDAVSGDVLATIPTAGYATQPDVSPLGTSLTYVQATTASQDWIFTGGAILARDYDASTGGFGAEREVVATGPSNNYYPSISPDGGWVLFNRSTGDSYDDGNASLWVVPLAGGTPIALDLADLGPNLTNSWARWAPFEQSVDGEAMFWITFSSKRDFGVRLVGANRPQIWMAPFFPGRAAAGVDPTGPAFRLPFQDLATSNHIAQWTEQVVPLQ
ncbi:MAG: hypothetical protein R2939_14965 [Kofleriaceae bacterium]